MCCQIVDSPNIKGKENTWYFRIFSCSFLLEKDKATRDAWYYQCTHWNGLSFWGFLYFRSFPAPFISTPLKLNMEPLFMAMVSSKPQKLLFHIQNSHTIWSSIPKKKRLHSSSNPSSPHLQLRHQLRRRTIQRPRSGTPRHGWEWGYQVRDTYRALSLHRDDTIAKMNLILIGNSNGWQGEN